MCRISGFVKELSYALIVYQVFISIGIGRSYVVFLFHQLDLPESKIIISDEQKSRIASSIGILSPLGCFFSGTLMDLFGRRLYFFITFIPQIISWIMIALATNYDMLLYGMIIQGINLGMGFIASTYIPEIVLPSRRGAILGSLTVSFNVGVTICNTLMYYVSWNVAAWIYAAFSIICMLSMLLLPESPVWLYSKGKKEAAIRTLASLRCSNIEDIKHEIDDMVKCSASAQRPATSFTTLMKSIRFAWKPSLIAVSLQLLFQLTGYTILFGYTISTFEQLKLPTDSKKFTVVYSVAGVLGAICAPLLMHKLNRKTHLSLCALIMAICTIIVALYEEIFYLRNDKPLPYIVFVAFYLYSFVANAGTLPISYSIGSEMYPGEVRGTMNGIFGMMWYICWSIILKICPALFKTFDIRNILWFFTGFCQAIVLFAVFILPETKGKTLNQVQEQYFQKKKKITGNENELDKMI